MAEKERDRTGGKEVKNGRERWREKEIKEGEME